MSNRAREVLEQMGADHLVALQELYCRPDRQRLGTADISSDMQTLKLYRPGDVGMQPMTHLGFSVVRLLIDQGKWPIISTVELENRARA